MLTNEPYCKALPKKFCSSRIAYVEHISTSFCYCGENIFYNMPQ